MSTELAECREGQRELNRIIVESNNIIRETEVKYKGYLKQFAIDTTTARKEAEAEMAVLKKTIEDLKPGIKKAYDMYQDLGAGHSDYIQPDGEKGWRVGAKTTPKHRAISRAFEPRLIPSATRKCAAYCC